MVKIITTLKSHKLLIIVSVVMLMVLIGGGYLSRGWLRRSVFPRLYAVKYKNQVNGVAAETYYSLGNPFAFLGLANLDGVPTRCELDKADGFKTSLTCIRSTSPVIKDLVTSEDFQSYKTWINTISKNLVSQGWAIDKENSTVNDQPINEASAANPDAIKNMLIYYDKQTKGVDCSLSITFHDFDNLTSRLMTDYYCHETKYFFGNPY